MATPTTRTLALALLAGVLGAGPAGAQESGGDEPFATALAAGIGLGGSTRAFRSMARVSWRLGS
jgi:hypothetical protein